MYNPYHDIRDKIAEEPKWHDENGVPRYCDFAHDECANIYAQKVWFFEIACQSCGQRFKVVQSWDWGNEYHKDKDEMKEAELKDGGCYGDAPWHETDRGICSGTTMSVMFVRFIEIWVQGVYGAAHQWKKIDEATLHKLEQEIEK